MYRRLGAIDEADQLGSTVVETAVLVPIAMLIVLIVVQLCIWAHGATLVQNAAAEGEHAATLPGGSAATAIAQTRELLKTTAEHVVVDPSVRIVELSAGEVQVIVSGSVESIIPGFDLPVSASRLGFIQEFRQSG